MRYGPTEQGTRERAYDDGLWAVEREVKQVPLTKTERLAAQDRLIATFARFAASALGLEMGAVNLITNDFLPAGAEFARGARKFDAGLSRMEIIQACRNAWTAIGLQPLLRERARMTPSIFGYSLLYPYTDNYLDGRAVASDAKITFCARFRDRLRGKDLSPLNAQENAPWALVGLIERQYPRARFPQVFDCMLAIHRAQEESVAQLLPDGHLSDAEVMRISCAKGGTSVLSDACLARGRLTGTESRFSFAWGVLLQLGDDLQDVHDDLQRGSITLFTRAVALGMPLDGLVMQLLNFSERVGGQMNDFPDGPQTLKGLLKMSWQSLIIGAVANANEFFSAEFLREAESRSPFSFAFLRERQNRLTAPHGLYEKLFEAFLESEEGACKAGSSSLPSSDRLRRISSAMASA